MNHVTTATGEMLIYPSILPVAQRLREKINRGKREFSFSDSILDSLYFIFEMEKREKKKYRDLENEIEKVNGGKRERERFFIPFWIAFIFEMEKRRKKKIQRFRE